MKVMIFGTFDGLHPGHEHFLRQALGRGSLSVVVARDETVVKIKGKAPTQNENERKAAIERIFPDVKVMLGNAIDYLAPVRAEKPDLILLGYDQRLPPGMRPEDLPAKIERAEAWKPDVYKSSFLRKENML